MKKTIESRMIFQIFGFTYLLFQFGFFRLQNFEDFLWNDCLQTKQMQYLATNESDICIHNDRQLYKYHMLAKISHFGKDLTFW